MNGKTPSLLEGKEQAAVYRFNEQTGTRIQDQTNRHDLLMLPRFNALQKEILVPPWQDFRFNLSYFEDIMVNMLGFIPLGFLILAYLSSNKITSTRYLYIITIFFGTLISLAIELLQVYLPTRSSQLMDVFTNILGTFLGTTLFHFYQSRKKS
jgi:glycopeptide antibiotics resistance protein